MKFNEKAEISDLHVITVNCVTTENSARETTFLRRKERKCDTPEDLKNCWRRSRILEQQRKYKLKKT